MSPSVLDRVEQLQSEGKSNRSKAWLDLVTGYVDGNLPTPEQISRIFDDCGKNRTDLEHDGAILREYRSLLRVRDSLPALQQEYNKLSVELKDANTARDEAVKQADLLIEKAASVVAQVIEQSNHISHKQRQARQAAVTLQDSAYAWIDETIDPDSLEVRKIKAEIADIERQIAQLDLEIKNQNNSVAQIQSDTDSINLSDSGLEDKQKKIDELGYRGAAVTRTINSLTDRKYFISQDLTAKRRELQELQPNGKPSKTTNGQGTHWGW